jgi:N-acetylmuramoyl-L-alanine amidase
MRHSVAGTRRIRPAWVDARRAAPAVALALALAQGCAPPPKLAPTPPPIKTPPPAGYDGRRDSLDSVDATAVRGKRIVLDPGHGGFFRGTVGVNGLTEKEVNLGVALELRDLLRAAGAEVFLTRETDRDFLTPADSSLRADLAERSRIANAFAPDLFVSVHHNADPNGAHDVNETQTYYQLGDEGPSYDAAQDVFRATVRNLGIAVRKLIPGNFFVVRTSEAPALLTEASFLTYPPTEEKLRTPEARRLEAEAFYLGIVRYFMRRAPALESFAALDAAGRPDTAFLGPPRIVARLAGAFDVATLRIDGAEVPVTVTGPEVAWSGAPPLAAGAHEATISARLAGQGAARARRLRFHVRKPAARVLLSVHGSPLDAERPPVGVRARVLDADDLPLPDSLRVRLASEPRGVFTPAETTVVARDGEAWAYLRRARGVSARLARRATLVARLVAPAGSPAVPAARHALARDTVRTRSAFVLRMPEDVALVAAPDLRPAWLNRDGFVALAADSAGRAQPPRLAGFRRWGEADAWPPRLAAVAGGALHGRRIALDPEGGGDDAGGTASGGTRASALNLEVARALGAMLEAAGAAVVLTRDGDQAVSELGRVQVAEGFRAERYLRIGHANTAPLAGHYFSSGGGRRWAEGLVRALADLGLPAVGVGESSKYPIAQVSAVALYASLARVDSSEAALLAPGRTRAEAYALFLALARDLAPPAAPVADAAALDSLLVRDADDRPVAGAAVRLGAALVVATDTAGIARFARTEPGPLPVEVEDARAPARAVLLDSERGRILRAPR